MTLHVLRPMTARQNESSPIIIPWHSSPIGGKLRRGASFIGQPRQNIQQEWPRLLETRDIKYVELTQISAVVVCCIS